MKITCVYCAHKMDSHSQTSGGKKQPRTGDVSICIRCGGVMLFTETGVREPDAAETLILATDPRIQIVSKAFKSLNMAKLEVNPASVDRICQQLNKTRRSNHEHN